MNYSVIQFRGSDWREWLQGQITQDIGRLSPSKSIGFCLCKPTGQLLSFGELVEEGDCAFAIVPEPSAKSILDRVELMVILEDCEAEVVLRPDLLPEPLSEFDRLSRYQPEFGVDTHEKTLPPELGPLFEEKYLNYNKGCYTGQEVLQRIHSRGHTNRTWTVFRSSSPEIKGDGFEQTSNAEGPDGVWLVAGYLRSEADPPAGALVFKP